MPTFVVSCRGVLDPSVIAQLDAQGVYLATGGPFGHPASERHHHHLSIEASDENEALRIAQQAVEAAGGDVSGWESHGEKWSP